MEILLEEKLWNPSTLGEVRLRVAGRTANKEATTKIVNEVETFILMDHLVAEE